jgi:hypothetical protein
VKRYKPATVNQKPDSLSALGDWARQARPVGSPKRLDTVWAILANSAAPEVLAREKGAVHPGLDCHSQVD